MKALLFQSTSCSTTKELHNTRIQKQWLAYRDKVKNLVCQVNYYLFPWPSYFLSSALVMAVVGDSFCLSHSWECDISRTSYQVGLKDELLMNCGQRSKVTQHVILGITQQFIMLIMATFYRCLRWLNEDVPKGQRSSSLWQHYILQKMLWPLFNATAPLFSPSHCRQASL